MIFFIL